MSADSPRRGLHKGAQVVSPQPIVDRSIIDSVAGIINDIVPQAYAGTPNPDNKESISWARFEYADVNDPTFYPDYNEGSGTPPLFLVLGYSTGVQVWLISATGEATEVLSWRQGVVRTLRILPNPKLAEGQFDSYEGKRPIIAICDSAVPGAQFCKVNFVSLRTGEQVKSIKFPNPVCDVLANRRSVVVTLLERIAVFDARTLDDVLRVTTCYPSPGPNPNPIALGTRWLAYSEKKLLPAKRSSGGCEGEGVQSYTATVLYAAKSLGKGLRGLGETVASSLTGNSVSPVVVNNTGCEVTQPGVVTILDLQAAKEENELEEGCLETVVAHFTAHSDAIVAMTFDLTGALLMTADKRGHDFHVFRVQPHPGGPSLAAVHHLYILHRGDTTAKVQDMVFSSDTRWAAISTIRGTTHVFPVAPYGGPAGVRTHSSPHVVNRLSRFHRSAGLMDDTTRSHSPVPHTELPLSVYPYSNPRLPPYPHPTVLHPLAQIRQPSSLSHGANQPQQSRPQQRQRLHSDDSGTLPLKICACFAPPRAWMYAQRDSASKTAKRAVDSLFIMACHGNMIQYDLEPRPTAGVPKEKVCDDTMIELDVEAKGQWPLLRSPNSLEIVPPLSPSSPLLSISTHAKDVEETDLAEDRWLSQVEIVTHAGPHRRLWMGPQFAFKTYNATSGAPVHLVEAEAVDVGVTGGSRPARSNPMNMPHTASRSMVPLVIDGSGSSYEQSPRFMEAYGDCLEAEAGGGAGGGGGGGAQPVQGSGENQLREDLAEAMLETSAAPHRAAGRRTVLERSCHPVVAKVVNPLGTVITVVSAEDEEADAVEDCQQSLLGARDTEPTPRLICAEVRTASEPLIDTVPEQDIRELNDRKSLCVEVARIPGPRLDYEREETFREVPSSLSLCVEAGEIPASPMSQARRAVWPSQVKITGQHRGTSVQYLVDCEEESVVLMRPGQEGAAEVGEDEGEKEQPKGDTETTRRSSQGRTDSMEDQRKQKSREEDCQDQQKLQSGGQRAQVRSQSVQSGCQKIQGGSQKGQIGVQKVQSGCQKLQAGFQKVQDQSLRKAQPQRGGQLSQRRQELLEEQDRAVEQELRKVLEDPPDNSCKEAPKCTKESAKEGPRTKDLARGSKDKKEKERRCTETLTVRTEDEKTGSVVRRYVLKENDVSVLIEDLDYPENRPVECKSQDKSEKRSDGSGKDKRKAKRTSIEALLSKEEKKEEETGYQEPEEGTCHSDEDIEHIHRSEINQLRRPVTLKLDQPEARTTLVSTLAEDEDDYEDLGYVQSCDLVEKGHQECSALRKQTVSSDDDLEHIQHSDVLEKRPDRPWRAGRNGRTKDRKSRDEEDEEEKSERRGSRCKGKNLSSDDDLEHIRHSDLGLPPPNVDSKDPEKDKEPIREKEVAKEKENSKERDSREVCKDKDDLKDSCKDKEGSRDPCKTERGRGQKGSESGQCIKGSDTKKSKESQKDEEEGTKIPCKDKESCTDPLQDKESSTRESLKEKKKDEDAKRCPRKSRDILVIEHPDETSVEDVTVIVNPEPRGKRTELDEWNLLSLKKPRNRKGCPRKSQEMKIIEIDAEKAETECEIVQEVEKKKSKRKKEVPAESGPVEVKEEISWSAIVKKKSPVKPKEEEAGTEEGNEPRENLEAEILEGKGTREGNTEGKGTREGDLDVKESGEESLEGKREEKLGESKSEKPGTGQKGQEGPERIRKGSKLEIHLEEACSRDSTLEASNPEKEETVEKREEEGEVEEEIEKTYDKTLVLECAKNTEQKDNAGPDDNPMNPEDETSEQEARSSWKDECPLDKEQKPAKQQRQSQKQQKQPKDQRESKQRDQKDTKQRDQREKDSKQKDQKDPRQKEKAVEERGKEEETSESEEPVLVELLSSSKDSLDQIPAERSSEEELPVQRESLAKKGNRSKRKKRR